MARVAGLLLAGGRSSRFGSDKALATIDGVTLLDRAVACLRAACDGPVLVASGDGTSRAGVADGQVADRVAAAGPLSGIAGGLTALRDDAPLVAVLAVDHVAPSPALLRLLAGRPGTWACRLVEVDGRRQPLQAVWSTTVAADVTRAVDTGTRSVLRWLDGRDDVLVVPGDSLRAAGIRPAATRDVDTPDDLTRHAPPPALRDD